MSPISLGEVEFDEFSIHRALNTIHLDITENQVACNMNAPPSRRGPFPGMSASERGRRAGSMTGGGEKESNSVPSSSSRWKPRDCNSICLR